MMDALKKKLGVSADAPVTETPEFAQLSADFATLNTAYTSLQADHTAALAALEDSKNKLTELQAFAEQMNAAKAAAEAEAKAVKMSARKTAIVEAVGDAQADSILAATEALDDTAFALVASSLKGRVADEASSALFKEVGVDGNVDADKPKESAEMRILKDRYKSGAK